MSHLRRFMLLSCIVLTIALWWWASVSPDVHTGLPAWPLQIWSTFGLLNALMSTQPKGRRGLFSAALLLGASTQAVQTWHILMPYEDWLAAGMPEKPSLASWPSLLAAQGHDFLSLKWVPGCSHLPWFVWCLGAPLCLITQVVNGNHPVMPAWSRMMAKVAAAHWCLTLLMALGTVLVGPFKDAPIWFWIALVILLPLQLKSTPIWLIVPVWLACLSGLLVSGVHRVIDPTLIRDGLFALSMSMTVLNWLIWYVRMDAILRFDSVLAGLRELFPQPTPPQTQADSAFNLIAHLDSPQAQEGADKYTRE